MLAALMNSDVATWYENELRSAKNSQLVAVSNIPLEIPIHFLISRNASNNETKSVFDCMIKSIRMKSLHGQSNISRSHKKQKQFTLQKYFRKL